MRPWRPWRGSPVARVVVLGAGLMGTAVSSPMLEQVPHAMEAATMAEIARG